VVRRATSCRLCRYLVGLCSAMKCQLYSRYERLNSFLVLFLCLVLYEVKRESGKFCYKTGSEPSKASPPCECDRINVGRHYLAVATGYSVYLYRESFHIRPQTAVRRNTVSLSRNRRAHLSSRKQHEG
jgi:hypothetical protein